MILPYLKQVDVERINSLLAYQTVVDYADSMENLQQIDEKPDEELAALSLTDQRCFAALVDRYQDKLKRYLYKISSMREEEVEDLLQEIFIKAYYNLNSFDLSLTFSSWIYRIAHNHLISAYRKKNVRAHGHSISIDDKYIVTLASGLDTKREADISLLRENIQQVLQEMDLKYREVLILKFLEEKDYKEISDILRKPIGTVGTLINRAKKQFKKQAQQLGLDLY